MHKKTYCFQLCVLLQSDITLRRCNKSTLAIVLNPRFDNVILSYAHKLISLQYLILSLCCLGMISVLILKFFHLNLFSHGTFICHCLRKNHHDLKYHQLVPCVEQTGGKETRNKNRTTTLFLMAFVIELAGVLLLLLSRGFYPPLLILP